MSIKEKIYEFLRWSEKYTETDMVYLAEGGFWLNLGKVVTSFCSFLVMIAFARFVSKEIYGIYQYVLSMVAILTIFTLPEIETSLTRSVAKGKEGTIYPCFKAKISWGILGGLISLGISGYYFFHQNNILALCFFIAAIFLPIMDSFELYFSFWQGKKRFDIQNKYFICVNLLATLCLILAIFLTKNLFLILLTYFSAHTFFRAIFFKLTLKKLENQEKDLEAVSFGKHLTLMRIAEIAGTQLDKILIWQFLGPVFVATYSFALLPVLKLREMIPIFPLALPKLSQRSLSEIKSTLLKKFLKLFWISIPLAIFYILLVPFLFKIFFPAYLESIPYAQALGFILIFVPFPLIGTSLIAQMRKRELYLIRFLTPSLKIILFLILLPLYGIWGAVTAILIAQIFSAGLVLFLFKRM
jgi:O-antigen/teichoic acid export membrane protein